VPFATRQAMTRNADGTLAPLTAGSTQAVVTIVPALSPRSGLVFRRPGDPVLMLSVRSVLAAPVLYGLGALF
jgi:hypothetical protein